MCSLYAYSGAPMSKGERNSNERIGPHRARAGGGAITRRFFVYEYSLQSVRYALRRPSTGSGIVSEPRPEDRRGRDGR